MSRLPPRLAAVLGALALAVPAAAQPSFDHLACFKVKDQTGPATYTFSLTNAAGTQNCVAKLPAKLGCFESAESNVVPTPPGGGPSPGPAVGAVLCYQTKCRRPFTPAAQMEDQFGARMVVFKGAQFMCAPATRGPVGIAPPTTTTTATPAMPFHRWPVPGTVRRGRGLLGGGVERLVRVPGDALRAGGRAHVRRLLHRPEQGVRLQPDGLQLRAHPVGGDCQRDATALTTIAQTLSPAVSLNPKTRMGSCPETLRTRCESVWNASTPAKKMTTSRFVMAGGCEAP